MNHLYKLKKENDEQQQADNNIVFISKYINYNFSNGKKNYFIKFSTFFIQKKKYIM